MFYSSARIFLSIFILLIFSLQICQFVGDYRSNGDGNWSTLATVATMVWWLHG
jgi:hypothetical protein